MAVGKQKPLMGVEMSVVKFGRSDPLDERQELLSSVHDMLGGRDQLAMFPANFKLILEERLWEHERRSPNGRIIPPMSLHALIYEHYPDGLGATFDIVENIIRDHAEVLKLWTLAVGRPAGAPQGNKNAAKLEEPARETIVNNVNDCLLERPQGNSAAAGLRRLHAAAMPIIDPETGEVIKDGDQKAAALLARVEANELSVNAACIEMGWRKKTIVVPDNVESLSDQAAKRWGALATIRRLLPKLTYDERCQLRSWLDELDAAQ
jgi:hypothetical protein